MSQTYIIGVCGASCSGKTTICHKIIEKINSILGTEQRFVTVLSQDSYYFGGDSKINYDIPDSVDFNLMLSQIQDLKNGKEIDSPIYDYSTFMRQKETKKIYPTKIILIEGILIFSCEKLRNLCNLKVFVSASPELRYQRRIQRDIRERGYTEEEVKERYFRDVLPASRYYVDPSNEFSDIVLMNNIPGKFVGLDILLDHLEKKLKEIQ